MTFDKKNKLAEHLGKCLVILPNDEYLKNMFFELTEDLFIDSSNKICTNRQIGKLRSFITSILDFDSTGYNKKDLRKCYPTYELHNFFIENLPSDIRNKKLFILRNVAWQRDCLEQIATDILNNEIRKFYNENKIIIHVKNTKK